MAQLKEGDRIYYTGDKANAAGWFTAYPQPGGRVALVGEADKRELWVTNPARIGDVYQGHCNPRFVTEAAYRAYRPANIDPRD